MTADTKWMGVSREGTVLDWHVDEGSGRLAADDGEILIAVFSFLVNVRDLQAGQRVSFAWHGYESDGGLPVAEEIIVLDAGDERAISV